MRIIKRGQIPKDKVYQGTCTYCKTTVVGTSAELLIRVDRDEEVIHASCPVCEKKTLAIDESK